MDRNMIYEKPQTNKTFEQLREEIQKELANKEYSLSFLTREFTKDEVLRRSYLSLVSKNPARVHDIYTEGSFADKKQIYRKLYRLKVFGLTDQIPVSSVTMKKGKKTLPEKEIIKVFKDWTSKMHPTMKQHFEAKTNFWVLTDRGKDVNLVNTALTIERGSYQNE